MGESGRLQGPHEINQVLFLLSGQLKPLDKVEELHGVFQGEQAAVMQIWRRFLYARRAKVFMGPSAEAIRPFTIWGLKKRSALRLCMRLSV